MQKGNVNGAIKVLSNNMKGGVLPLNDETLNSLAQKHEKASEIREDITLQEAVNKIIPIVFHVIDETIVLKAAKITK